MTPTEVVQAQLDAYNAHDTDAFVAAYADDVEIFRPPAKEPVLSGKVQLKANYAERFRNPALHADLVARQSVGAFVVDHERVTGVAEDAMTAVAVFEVRGNLIRRVWFFNPD